MRNFLRLVPLVPVIASLCGCLTAYRWTSSVPEGMRTVSVPTFRNESNVTELGNLAARQILREIQREGTFKIARPADAAVEIQGVVKSAGSRYSAGDRRTGMRLAEFLFTVVAEVSVVDHVNGRVLIDNRRYVATTTYVANQDLLTGERDASARAAEDLSRQVVDDLTAMQW